MEKDEFFLKRIRELANLSWQRDIVTFSDFLNLNEQNIVRRPEAMRMRSVRWLHFILMLLLLHGNIPSTV